jgi:hypothetical protein
MGVILGPGEPCEECQKLFHVHSKNHDTSTANHNAFIRRRSRVEYVGTTSRQIPIADIACETYRVEYVGTTSRHNAIADIAGKTYRVAYVVAASRHNPIADTAGITYRCRWYFGLQC